LNLDYHRLFLAAGSVNVLPMPGVAPVSPSTHAHDFRGVAEALYLRDRIIRVELAAASDDAAERDARCMFVVASAGSTGTQVATQGPLFTTAIAKRHRELRGQKMRWLLLDVAPNVMPELTRVPPAWRTGCSGAEASRCCYGEFVPARSLVWCVGVRPHPLVEQAGLATPKGRLVVDPMVTVPGHRVLKLLETPDAQHWPEILTSDAVAAKPPPET
jgi:NADH dehydrogenase